MLGITLLVIEFTRVAQSTYAVLVIALLALFIAAIAAENRWQIIGRFPGRVITAIEYVGNVGLHPPMDEKASALVGGFAESATGPKTEAKSSEEKPK